MNPWLGIVAVLFVLGILVGLVRLLQGRIPPELSRKAVHVGMGLICLTFPWIFREGWPVVVLALLAVINLAAVRYLPFLHRQVGGVLGGVERQSFGEFYFPLAVAAVFLLAHGNTVLYIIPVLTLTVADSVGALIGVRYGFARYRTDEGLKSAEGSVAFFTAAFLSCHIPLLLFTTTGRPETLLIGLTAGFVVMLLEAISWRGQDNIIIPIGMFFLLERYLPLGVTALTTRLLIVIGLVLLTLLWRKRTTLSDSALLAGALSGYAVWAFGGWWWFFPLVLLFLIYAWLPAFPAATRPIQNLHAVTRVMAGGFLWLALSLILDQRDLLIPYFLCLAAHTGNIIAARLGVLREHYSRTRILLNAWLLPTILFGLLGAISAWFGVWSWCTLLVLPLSVALSVAAFLPTWQPVHTPENRARNWFAEAGIAVLASLLGLLL